MALSPPAQAMVACAAIFLVSWVLGAALQIEAFAWPLGAALVGFLVALGVRLLQGDRGWVRALGALVIAAVVVGLLLLALVLWYGSAICDSCD